MWKMMFYPEFFGLKLDGLDYSKKPPTMKPFPIFIDAVSVNGMFAYSKRTLERKTRVGTVDTKGLN